MDNKAKSATKRQNALVFFLGLALLALSAATLQESLARFWHVFVPADSAKVATFNVTIVTPQDFPQHADSAWEYYFISASHAKTLYFEVNNHGEADIRCTPHVTQGIWYHVLIAGEDVPDFIVKGGEAVSFHLILLADGLDTSITEADLLIDIEQV